MELCVINSNSRGNGYVLQDEHEALMIEAGCKFSEVEKVVEYNIGKIKGCIVSHIHNDHARYVYETAKSGIPVLAPENVAHAKHVQHGRGYKLGNFRIIPLSVTHDVVCFSYVITHPSFGRLVFITDTPSFNYEIEGVTHLLIEANYSDFDLKNSVVNGSTPQGVADRVVLNHMEINETARLVRQFCQGNQLYNVVLLHLSSANSNGAEFKKVVARAAGIEPKVAKSGLRLELTESPF